ncbi:hypothetical protein BD779DRAFT_530461 [Infundibulicybe gibba]|nr:hypothetical protein BD779DRAFT_530461 [Infundibulicybe gibba]
MHRCLLIPVVLQTICIYIDNYPKRGRDLLAMALVCRGFSKTSLDQLWREIDGLYPLLTKMPPDMWSGPLARHNVVLARAITPSDLGCFKAHAHRVRIYHGLKDADDDTDVPITVYKALSFHFHDQPIFPNLVGMSWTNEEEIFPYITMFLGSRIRRMELPIFDDPVHNSMLPTLGKRCPLLINFNLRSDVFQYSLDTGRQVKSLLSQWSQLETLSIHHLPEDSLRIVVGLPHLRNLRLKGWSYAGDNYGNTFTPAPGTKVFPALQNLSITTTSSILCINLLKAATSCPLVTFYLSLIGSSLPNWRDLFTTLAKSCDKGTLTTILIDGTDVQGEHGHGPNAAYELRLLFPFTNLTDAAIHTSRKFDVEEAFVFEMAAAWPHLHSFSMTTVKGTLSFSSTTQPDSPS